MTRLLEQQFASLVDYDFTARMEDTLDEIAAGRQDRVGQLSEFYFGGSGEHRGRQPAEPRHRRPGFGQHAGRACAPSPTTSATSTPAS